MGRLTIIDRFEDLSDEKKIAVLLELLDSFDNNNAISEVEKKKLYDDYIGVIENIKYIDDLIDLKNNLNIFKSLPEKRKWIVLSAFLKELDEQNKRFIRDKRIAQCSVFGHMFNEWEKDCRITTGDAYYDREVIHNYTKKTDYWYRKCARCGYVEEVYQKPQELIDKEIKEKNDKEINELEKKLRKLKGE